MTICKTRISGALALVCAAVLSAVSAPARAQSEDQAAARALFEEGRGLMKTGQYAAACPKLEAARKLYTSAGILLNLADCHEKIGRTASAWTEFGEAATVAARTQRATDAEEARRRQSALEPALARVVIRVAHPAPGLTVERDGATLASAAWGAALPVDPGPHAIRVEAPGFEPWTGSVTVSKPGQTVTVDVPELHALAVAAEPTGPPGPTTKGANSPETGAPTARSGRTLPWVLVGGGAAVAVGGGVLMLIESGRATTARDNHDQHAYDATTTPWAVGLAGAIVGVASAAVGAALLAIAPGDAGANHTAVAAWLGTGAGGGGLLLARSW